MPFERERIIFGDSLEVNIPKERLAQGTNLYIAGGQGFMESTRTFHNRVVQTVQVLGGEGLDPWNVPPQLKREIDAVDKMPVSMLKVEAWRKLNRKIVDNNMRLLGKAGGVIANLDGSDVDSGTAAEIGFAYARGIPILGYRGDFRLSSDNIGGIVNIQVEEMIRQSAGGRGDIITKISDLPKALLGIWGK